jgi:hypothetical protein
MVKKKKLTFSLLPAATYVVSHNEHTPFQFSRNVGKRTNESCILVVCNNQPSIVGSSFFPNALQFFGTVPCISVKQKQK